MDSEDTEHQQDHDDQDDKSDQAAWIIAPTPAMRPSRDGAEQNQDEYNQQDGSECHDEVLFGREIQTTGLKHCFDTLFVGTRRC